MLLNLAYAPRPIVKSFVFGPGVSKSFKEAVDSARITGALNPDALI